MKKRLKKKIICSPKSNKLQDIGEENVPMKSEIEIPFLRIYSQLEANKLHHNNYYNSTKILLVYNMPQVERIVPSVIFSQHCTFCN